MAAGMTFVCDLLAAMRGRLRAGRRQNTSLTLLTFTGWVRNFLAGSEVCTSENRMEISSKTDLQRQILMQDPLYISKFLPTQLSIAEMGNDRIRKKYL
jgi:hypothetical protein